MKKKTNLDKFYSYFMKSDFDKKYPLFAKYSFDTMFKNNAVENQDLFRKYTEYNNSIEIYLYELDKRFDIDTVRKLIVDTIVKYPDEIMMSLITSYLNSDESVKSNASFVNFYNKTSNFGTESIEYMQENGIVLDRSYRDIPALAIDSKYDSLKTGNESFKEERLEDIYDSLTYPQRRFVLSLIEGNSYELLDLLFSRFNFNTKLLINVLMGKGINGELINNTLISKIDSFPLMILFCYIIEKEDSDTLVRNVLYLVRKHKYDLLSNIINNNLLDSLSIAREEELENMTDDKIIELLTVKCSTLHIKEEAA